MVYFLDYTLGCAWWVMVLYLVQLFAVLVVRGKPYGAEQVVAAVLGSGGCSGWLAPLLAFTWSLVRTHSNISPAAHNRSITTAIASLFPSAQPFERSFFL